MQANQPWWTWQWFKLVKLIAIDLLFYHTHDQVSMLWILYSIKVTGLYVVPNQPYNDMCPGVI